mmetsp:Transcript_17790/g.50074  ORF Transcript_17790/g.50074 Transcript_17790/m.50074 type:complete len:236 (-) Transcript_17790:699-1406(-)
MPVGMQGLRELSAVCRPVVPVPHRNRLRHKTSVQKFPLAQMPFVHEKKNLAARFANSFVKGIARSPSIRMVNQRPGRTLGRRIELRQNIAKVLVLLLAGTIEHDDNVNLWLQCPAQNPFLFEHFCQVRQARLDVLELLIKAAAAGAGNDYGEGFRQWWSLFRGYVLRGRCLPQFQPGQKLIEGRPLELARWYIPRIPKSLILPAEKVSSTREGLDVVMVTLEEEQGQYEGGFWRG